MEKQKNESTQSKDDGLRRFAAILALIVLAVCGLLWYFSPKYDEDDVYSLERLTLSLETGSEVRSAIFHTEEIDSIWIAGLELSSRGARDTSFLDLVVWDFGLIQQRIPLNFRRLRINDISSTEILRPVWEESSLGLQFIFLGSILRDELLRFEVLEGFSSDSSRELIISVGVRNRNR